MSIEATIKTVEEVGRCSCCRYPKVDPDTGKSLEPDMFVAEISFSGMSPRLCHACLYKLERVVQQLLEEMP